MTIHYYYGIVYPRTFFMTVFTYSKCVSDTHFSFTRTPEQCRTWAVNEPSSSHLHLHFQTPPLFPAVNPRGKHQTLAIPSHETPRPEPLPVGLQPYISLWSSCQDAVGQKSRWRKANFQLPAPLSRPRNFLDGNHPLNISLLLILPFSTSLIPSSYFTSHMWEIPQTLTLNPQLYWTCSLLLVLWRLWSILSKSICAKRRLDWIILTFGSVMYLCVVGIFFFRMALQKVRERCGFMFSLDPVWQWFAGLLLHFILL